MTKQKSDLKQQEIISFRVTPDEKLKLVRAAKKRRKTRTAFVKELFMPALEAALAEQK